MCIQILITIILITFNSIENINGEKYDTENFELSHTHINFCGIGSDFQRDLVFSLVYEYQYAYFVKLARLYRDGLKQIRDAENQIKGLRNKKFQGNDRRDNWLSFKGQTINLNATFQKTHQELDEMTNNVEGGISREIATLISDRSYREAGKRLADAGNDGLIYSILYILYGMVDKNENLFLDHVFKFNQQLLDESYHMKASTIYLCSFSILVGDKKMFTHSMVRLAAYSQITSRYITIASRDLAKYDYIKLRKRYAYIRTGSPTGLQLLIWSKKKTKCIVNKKFDELFTIEPPKGREDASVYTQNYTGFNNAKYKWTFEFNLDDFTYRIMMEEKYLHLSSQLIDGLPKIVAAKEYIREFDSWKMIPIADNEFHIENNESKERLISGPDFDFTRGNSKRRVFAHRSFLDLSRPELRGIDVWYLVDC